MEHTVESEWKGDLCFDTQIGDHQITLDAIPEAGGHNMGPSPRPLLLAALSSCSGMDVALLLQKMRVKVDSIRVSATGELKNDHPRCYHTIHLVYTFSGKHLRHEKIEKAISLSQEKYCGVSCMLSKAAKITYEVHYDEKRIPALQH